MEFYVDTADIDVVKRIAEFYPIDGFTTNPKILTMANRPVEELMPEYEAYVLLTHTKIFIQVTGSTAEEMLEEAKACYQYFGGQLVMKIPAVKEGYKAVRLCKDQGIPTLVTVIHSMPQALVAAKAGASYVAPYVSHIDNIGADGVGTVSEMITALKNSNYDCKVLAASFRTVDQIKRLALAGCHAITIAPQFFDAMISHSSTNESMQGFAEAWSNTFGTKTIVDLLPKMKQ